MCQPEGYEIKDCRYACKLNKSICGLKQAARVWNEQLHETIIELGFKQSEVDSCLYFTNKRRFNLPHRVCRRHSHFCKYK